MHGWNVTYIIWRVAVVRRDTKLGFLKPVKTSKGILPFCIGDNTHNMSNPHQLSVAQQIVSELTFVLGLTVSECVF